MFYYMDNCCNCIFSLTDFIRYIFMLVREFRAVYYVLIFEIRPTMTVSLLIAKEIFSLNESWMWTQPKATFWMGNFYTSNCREVKRSIRPKNYTKMCKGLHTHIKRDRYIVIVLLNAEVTQTPDWIMIDRVHWPSLCTSHSNSLFDTYPLSFNWSYLLGQFISCNRGGKAS